MTRDQVESSEIFKKMGLMKYLDKPMQQLSSGLEKEDKTTIVVSHDLSFVHDTCDRVIILNDATIVLDKKMTDFTDVEELQKVYFVLTEKDDQSDC